jgi:hypothetical protein
MAFLCGACVELILHSHNSYNKHVNRTIFCYALLCISLRYILAQKLSTKNRRLHGRYASIDLSFMKKIISIFIVLLISSGCSFKPSASQKVTREEARTALKTMIEAVRKSMYKPCYEISDCAESIHEVIQFHWGKPENQNEICEEIRINLYLNSKKELSNVEFIVKSSRESVNDLALSAIKKSSPFIQLNGLDEKVYNKNFSSFILSFEPKC